MIVTPYVAVKISVKGKEGNHKAGNRALPTHSSSKSQRSQTRQHTDTSPAAGLQGREPALRELLHRAAPTVHAHLTRGEVGWCLRVKDKKKQRLLVLTQEALRTGKE